jgi:hypothetical protein
MADSAKRKTMQVVFYRRIPAAGCDWSDNSDWAAVAGLLESLAAELKGLNVDLRHGDEPTEIIVRGYNDILNSIRLRYPAGGFANTCLGHVIGCSANRDIAEDLKRGINRVLFAPETIEPQGSDKIVCHNCGCGC